ncbi:MAG: hypothetical protein JST54_28290 [Deltaproteobacteria bacterium]|nr:hypothetical protein [Deltaproteobacteria bacterium]
MALAELRSALPAGNDERFSGWGVMGLPFQNGDVLALRRFGATSIGEGYTSVWYRDPQGAWTIWANRPPKESCARYFGSALTRSFTTDVDVTWEGASRFRVRVPAAKLTWELTLGETGVTRVLNAMSRLMPQTLWRNPTLLGLMGKMAGPMLHAGQLGLIGKAPNGQWFIANPMHTWIVESSTASLAGRDFGAPAPLAEQTKLGDFWIPQRGVVAIGRSYFEPADPARHHLVSTMHAKDLSTLASELE